MAVGSASQLNADKTPWPRVDGPALLHVLFANVIQMAGLAHVILYVSLWNQLDAWRVDKRPSGNIGVLKFAISAAVPALLLAAVSHVPNCQGKDQWALYFGFIAYFGSFALELTFSGRRSHRD
jgi:hypothetical protein